MDFQITKVNFMEDTRPFTTVEKREYNAEFRGFLEGRKIGTFNGFFLGATAATAIFIAIRYLFHVTNIS
jgi:hypothetical protein